MPRDTKQKAAFDFFTAKLEAGSTFTDADLMEATGWAASSVETYLGKQFYEFIEERPGNKFRVHARFRRINWEEFRRISTQKRQFFQDYLRRSYDAIAQYEFLLPLTREDTLREALDSLFYSDAIEQRLEEIEADELEEWLRREHGERRASYRKRLVKLIGDTFGGYSISHVSGRFRDAEISTRAEAAALVAKRGAYVIDETTASVRFIIPLASTEQEYEGSFADSVVDVPGLSEVVFAPASVLLVRRLFFGLFVEAVVSSIQGEAEIWLIEHSPLGEKLFVWARRNA